MMLEFNELIAAIDSSAHSFLPSLPGRRTRLTASEGEMADLRLQIRASIQKD
jgi:hypothetical protein